VVRRILELTDQDESLMFVNDRPGHDPRYSLSSDKLNALGWRAHVRLHEGLARTVDWYRGNEWWWAPIRSGAYPDDYERHYGRALKV
jgi:dTDP-glucose 4,6-dehydratase